MLPAPIAGLMLVIGHSSEEMNLLIGQLSFPQASGRDGPWPPVGSQDASVSCSVINHAQ